jgi:hypothetical protein
MSCDKTIFNRPDMQEMEYQLKEKCIKSKFYSLAQDILKGSKSPQIEKQVLDLNLPD